MSNTGNPNLSNNIDPNALAKPAQQNAPAPPPDQLPFALPDKLKPFQQEIQTWLRELDRLLAEGEQGRFALIKGDQVLNTWDTYRDALQHGYDKFGPDEPFLIQRLDARDAEKLSRFIANKE